MPVSIGKLRSAFSWPMTWLTAEFAAIDFESAGSQPDGTDPPIQIGIACMKGGQLLPETFFRSYLQNTSRELHCVATTIHGIRPDQLTNAPPLLSLWPEVRNRLTNRYVVAHGAGTERRHLRVFPFHGFGPWIDTLQLARKLQPSLNDYSLGSLIAAFRLEEEIDQFCKNLHWHDALYDAVACLVLLQTLIKTSPHFLDNCQLASLGLG
ncbi:MAG: DNA polymerase III subunit epsilon [Verrucomicrobia bacterium]|nr:MAG: DNA polymerase III subunit epsilon [Verrucomicrobiota bacterium]